MKERYILLMEKSLSAYTDAHILRYFNEVKANGLTEHGFPRLAANIGILIAHGRRKDLLPLFTEMMDLCCDMFLRPYVQAANEFSVREIVCCIDALEKAKAMEEACLLRWKQKISQIIPEACYNFGDGELACLLPALSFDGEVSTEIRVDGPCLTVSYNGWICRYTVDGTILDTGRLAANRNGHYRAFLATAQDTLHVNIEIVKV